MCAFHSLAVRFIIFATCCKFCILFSHWIFHVSLDHSYSIDHCSAHALPTVCMLSVCQNYFDCEWLTVCTFPSSKWWTVERAQLQMHGDCNMRLFGTVICVMATLLTAVQDIDKVVKEYKATRKVARVRVIFVSDVRSCSWQYLKVSFLLGACWASCLASGRSFVQSRRIHRWISCCRQHLLCQWNPA